MQTAPKPVSPYLTTCWRLSDRCSAKAKTAPIEMRAAWSIRKLCDMLEYKFGFTFL